MKRGFAIVLVLVLLAFLVLLAVSLGSMVKLSTQTAATVEQQTQARQNALVGLRIALGDLQRYASAEDRVTAMAGVAGIGPGSRSRGWCGVWTVNGSFLGWLSSGAGNEATPTLQTGLTAVRLLDRASVGTANLANREQVEVGRVPINGVATMPAGAVQPRGAFAYWVGDEGVKVSAYVAPAFAPLVKLEIGELFPATKPPIAANVEKVLLFEQLKFAPVVALAPSEWQAMYHAVTVTHSRWVSIGGGVSRVDGLVNVNTTSDAIWTALGRTYNRYKGPRSAMLADPAQFGDRMRAQLPNAVLAKKVANGPFLEVAGLADSGLLDAVLAGTGVTADEFLSAVGPTLTVRSDTFRIRAYGDAVNRADASKTEARAFCEAIVQRQWAGGEFTFAIIAFHWLAAEDV